MKLTAQVRKLIEEYKNEESKCIPMSERWSLKELLNNGALYATAGQVRVYGYYRILLDQMLHYVEAQVEGLEKKEEWDIFAQESHTGSIDD